MTIHTKATAEQLPYRIHLAVEHALELQRELRDLSDDVWADDNTVRLCPPLKELRELIDAVQLLQTPLTEIYTATGRD